MENSQELTVTKGSKIVENESEQESIGQIVKSPRKHLYMIQ